MKTPPDDNTFTPEDRDYVSGTAGLWKQIEDHPRFQSMAPEMQDKLRTWYYQNRVMQAPAFQRLGKASPDFMTAFGNQFFAKSHERNQAAQNRATQQEDIYPHNVKEWLTKPTTPQIMDAVGLPTAENIPNENWFLKGVAKSAEGLTSPMNMGLAVLPLGKVAQGLGASARVARGVQAATSGAFALDMAHSGYQQAGQADQLSRMADEAEAKGDKSTAESYRNQRNQMLTEMAVSGLFTYGAAKHGAIEGRSAISNVPLPHEQMGLTHLGYDREQYPLGVNDAEHILQGSDGSPFGRPTAPPPETVQRNYPKPKSPPLTEKKAFAMGRVMVGKYLTPEVRAGLRDGSVDYLDVIPKDIQKNLTARMYPLFVKGMKAGIAGETVEVPKPAETTPVEAAQPQAQPTPQSVPEAPLDLTPPPAVAPTAPPVETKGVLQPTPATPRRTYSKPTPEQAVNEVLMREQAIKELQGKLTVAKPEEAPALEAALDQARNARRAAYRNFGQYADKDSVFQAITNMEGDTLARVNSMHDRGRDILLSQKQRALEAELNAKETTPDRRDEIHEMLGHQRHVDITDPAASFEGINDKASAESVFGGIRVHPFKGAPAKSADRIKASQAFALSRIGDPALDEDTRKQWHDILYGTNPKTGKVEMRNIEHVPGWFAPKSAPDYRLDKRSEGRTKAQLARERGDLVENLNIIDNLRRAKGFVGKDTEHSEALRRIMKTPKTAPEPPPELPAASPVVDTEGEVAHVIARAENIFNELGKSEELTHIRNYVNDRTDLAPNVRQAVYAKAMHEWMKAASEGGDSPLDAAYNAIKAAQAKGDADATPTLDAAVQSPEAPSSPDNAGETAPTQEQPAASRQEEVTRTAPPPPMKYTVDMQTGEQKAEPLAPGEYHAGPFEDKGPAPKPKTLDPDAPENSHIRNDVRERINAALNLSRTNAATRLDLSRKMFDAWRTLVKRGQDSEAALAKVMKVVPKALPELRFRSKAEDTAGESRIPEKSSGDQMLRSLLNAGVSPEEIKWTGLDDFLRSKPKTSRAEVKDFLAQNRVKIEEVTKDGPQTLTDEQQEYATRREQYGAASQVWEHAREEIDTEFHRAYPRGTSTSIGPRDHLQSEIRKAIWNGRLRDVLDSPYITPKLRQLIEEGAKAQETLAEHTTWLQRHSDVGPPDTTYEQYTLPGGTNYREVLLQLPPKPGDAADVRAVGSSEANVYRGPHFDEPNVLAHVRLKDRVTSDGKKVLFIEEVQSDWHQAGRTGGYRGTSPNENVDALYQKMKRIEPERNRLAQLPAETDDATYQRFLAFDREYQDLNDQIRDLEGRVPDAPFKSNWHELALRRVLQMAAEKGYDKIAWTTGEMQKARYPGATADAHGYLYDTMIPQYLNKFGKKFGARVGQTELQQEVLAGEPTPSNPRGAQLDKFTAPSLDITDSMRSHATVKEPYTFGLKQGLSRPGSPDLARELRDSFYATDSIRAAQARQHVENSKLGLRYDGDQMGLTWFTDPETGSTLAMTHRDVSSPAAVKAHVMESRASFARAAAAGRVTGVGEWLAALPSALKNVAARLPEHMLNAIYSVSPERATKMVAASVNPVLRDAMSATSTAVYTSNLKAMGKDLLGVYSQDPLTGEHSVQLRAKGALERLATWVRGWQNTTLDQAAAHEFGHRVAAELLPSMKLGDKMRLTGELRRAYPLATADIERRYGSRGFGSSDRRLDEYFAHSFLHYYMGWDGGHSTMRDVLGRIENPTVREQALRLQGQGALFTDPHGFYRIGDLAYRDSIGIPMAGLPARKPIISLMNSLREGDFARAIIREHAGDLRRATDQLYSGIDDFRKKFSGLSRAEYISAMDDLEGKPGATPHPWSPEDRRMIADLRDMLQERVQHVQARSPHMLEHLIEHYWPHLFEGSTFTRAWNTIMAGKRPLAGTKGFNKERHYAYASDALANGAQPVSYNPVDGVLARLHEMDRFIMAHDIKSDMKANSLIKFNRGLRRPAGIPADWATINDPIFNPMRPTSEGLVQTGRYWAPSAVARTLNNYLSPGLRGNRLFDSAREYGNMLNQAQLSMSAFHLTFEAINSSMSDFALGMQKTFMKGQRVDGLRLMGRAAIPFASGYHYYRLGALIREEWYNPGTHPHLSDLADAAMRSGGRIDQDPFYKGTNYASFMKSVKDRNWTMLPNAIKLFYEKVSWPILDHAVPRIKAGAFAEMARAKLDDMNSRGVTDHWARSAELDKLWDSVDNRMGQVVYDNLFWHKTYKDLAMLSVRSVGWNFGTFRELGGAGKDIAQMLRGRQKVELTSRIAYAMALPLIAGELGALYQSISTGKKPESPVDYFFPQTGNVGPGGKPERVALPSYMKDIYAYHEHAGETLVHKLHPMFQQLYDMYQNKDYYNTEIAHPGDPFIQRMYDRAKYLAGSFSPLGIQNYKQRVRATGRPGPALAQSAIGITPAPAYIGQSDAEQSAYDLATRHTEVGPLTTKEFQHRQAIRELENKFEAGKIGFKELDGLVRSGQLHPNDVDNIVEYKDMTPFQRHFKQLYLHEGLSVWEKSNQDERNAIRPMLLDKADELDSSRYTEQEREDYMKKLEAAAKYR